MRSLLPPRTGFCPASLLLSTHPSWRPPNDVIERICGTTLLFITTPSTVVGPESHEASVSEGDFHTFAVSWDPNDVIWYIDGREAARERTSPDLNKPMYMLANMGVGGYWPGNPDASTHFPAIYAIDYIRAYRFIR